MRLGAVLASVALAVALAGCFTADKPLLNDANSVAPYAKITFREQHATGTTTMTRNGKTYTSTSSDGTLTVRFMPVDRPNWYLTEISGPPDANGVQLLYGILRVDLPNKRADAFKTVGDAKDVRPGLRMCKDYICIDDVKAYVASAEAYADSGAPPDATYEVSVE
jgi:hypothetical protein